MVTEKEIPTDVIKNVSWLYPEQRDDDDDVEFALEQIENYAHHFNKSPNKTIITICKELDVAYDLPLGESLYEVRRLLAKRYFTFDISIPIIKLKATDVSAGDLDFIREEFLVSNQYDLLDGLLDIAKGKCITWVVLDSLYYVIGIENPAQAAKYFANGDVPRSILKLLDESKYASLESLEANILFTTLNEPMLDAGELILMICASEADDSGVFTGDKRALRTVHKLVGDKKMNLSDCIFISHECAIKVLLIQSDANDVIRKIRNNPHVDKALTNCFRCAEVQIVDGIDSYIRDLEKVCHNLRFMQTTNC